MEVDVVDLNEETAGRCRRMPGPCKAYLCRYNVVEVSWNKLMDLRTITDGCALRIVDENPDGMTLEDVGAALGVTRERVRQVEEQATRRIRILASEGNEAARILARDFGVDCGRRQPLRRLVVSG